MPEKLDLEEVKQLIDDYKQVLELSETVKRKIADQRTDVITSTQKHSFLSCVNNAINTAFLKNTEVDEKQPQIKDVIRKTYQVYMIDQELSHVQSLMQEYDKPIEAAINAISERLNGVKWFFTSKQRKQYVISKYTFLKNDVSSDYAKYLNVAVDNLKDIETVDAEEAWRWYEGDSQEFKRIIEGLCGTNTIKSLRGDIPAVSGAVKSAEDTANAYAKLTEKVERIKKDITDAVEYYQAQNVRTLLKEIPIEELGKEVKGVRIKSLKDAGYETVADIASASRFQIASVYGISEDAAFRIRDAADKYKKRVGQEMHIRLSADERTKEATRLVQAIYAYKLNRQTIKEISSAFDNAHLYVDESLAIIRGIKGGLSWLFCTEAEKNDYQEAFNRLSVFTDSDLLNRINKADRSVWKPKISVDDVWKDFMKDSIQYINILEEICPGIMGTDSQFGLPEDLAREIADEEFFPDGLKADLRRYQVFGVKYILHQGKVLLGDEMGLGKTVQAIAAMVSLRNTGATHFMVVCPASVLVNWCNEITRKSKLRVIKVHGTNRYEAFSAWQKTGGVAVTTYETTGRLGIDETLKVDMLVVDEAHYIKNAEANRSKYVTEIANRAGRVLFLTGTALENKVDEMISLISILNPALAERIKGYSFMSAAPQFREMIAPVYYRRKRNDVLQDLPKLDEIEEWCELSEEEREKYKEDVLARSFADIRRVSWNVDDVRYSSKAQRLQQIVEEAAAENRKVIVFSFFLDTIRKVSMLLGDRCTMPINGSVSPIRRQQIIDEFNDSSDKQVLVSQIQSGGTGLNIQSASVVIFCEPQLKPSIENQAISRAYRMGQARNVIVYRLLADDTIDERISELLAEKQAIFNAFADKSAAAQANQKIEQGIDETTFGKIIQEEIERINAQKQEGISA